MFDTLKYSRVLEAAGVSRDQTEAHIKIIAEIVEGDLTTKQDIKVFKQHLIQFENRLVIKLSLILGTIATLAIVITAAFAKAF